VFHQEGEESPANSEHRASEREDVREGIEVEKKITTRLRQACLSADRATAGKGEKAG